MLKERLRTFVDSHDFKHDIRKVGINLLTLGIVGMLVNAAISAVVFSIFWPSLFIVLVGFGALYAGIMR